MSRPRHLAFTSSLAILALIAGGCAQSNIGPEASQTSSIGAKQSALSPSDKKARSVKVALILPLGGYGEPARIARGMKQAAEMALFEADNPEVQLITKDDAGTPQGAMTAAEASIAEGAEIILGPLFGKSATAIAPIAAKAGVPVVTFSNDPTVAGHGVYLMSFLASEEVSRVIGYAASQGKRRFAALIPETTYGKTVEPPFRAAVSNSGGQIAALETYPVDGPGMLTAAKKIMQTIAAAEKSGAPVDALFVPAGPESMTVLGPLLAYSGLTNDKLKLLGTSAWDVPVVERDASLIGGWYAASDPSGWMAFSAKYQKSFGTVPPRLATLSYDAMTMALNLARDAGPGRYSSENLTRAQGFNGVDGTVRLTPGGYSQRGLAVLEIEKDRSVVIDAPVQGATSVPQAAAVWPEVLSHL